jgi:hypothetical protein
MALPFSMEIRLPAGSMDRRLTGVSLNGLENGPTKDGNTVYANVTLTFSNWSGEDSGPTIYFNLVVLCEDEDATIAKAERLVLDGIAGFLGRAARETGQSLHDQLLASRRRFQIE